MHEIRCHDSVCLIGPTLTHDHTLQINYFEDINFLVQLQTLRTEMGVHVYKNNCDEHTHTTITKDSKLANKHVYQK